MAALDTTVEHPVLDWSSLHYRITAGRNWVSLSDDRGTITRCRTSEQLAALARMLRNCLAAVSNCAPYSAELPIGSGGLRLTSSGNTCALWRYGDDRHHHTVSADVLADLHRWCVCMNGSASRTTVRDDYDLLSLVRQGHDTAVCFKGTSLVLDPARVDSLQRLLLFGAGVGPGTRLCTADTLPFACGISDDDVVLEVNEEAELSLETMESPWYTLGTYFNGVPGSRLRLSRSSLVLFARRLDAIKDKP